MWNYGEEPRRLIVRQLAECAPTIAASAIKDVIVSLLKETNGILDGSQYLAGVDKDDYGRIHEPFGVIAIVALLQPTGTGHAPCPNPAPKLSAA